MSPAIGALNQYGEDGLAILAFKIQALQFDLNRDLKFISMKDQLIRGRTLMLAAYQAGLIGPIPLAEPDTSNVIVIGAGVGGVSAALMACELGLSVTLVESDTACFPLLGLGSDRLFSATVYDWPHLHSGKHKFPYVEVLRDDETVKGLRGDAATLRFPSTARTASELRAEFLGQLDAYKTKFGARLKILCGYRLGLMKDISANEPGNVVAVKVRDTKSPDSKLHLEGQIAVFALGFGLDKDIQQTEAAKDFFSYCDLKKDIEAAVAGPAAGIVRIEGAGDGGLQEALRFVLQDEWHDLHRCVSRLEEILLSDGLGTEWLQLCSRLQSAEDQALRSLMWGYTDERIYSELHALYERETAALLAVAAPSVLQWHNEVVRQAPFKVQLLDRAAYSMKAYSLNRWLVGLLLHVAMSPGGAPGYVRIERVTPATADPKPNVTLRRYGFAGNTKPAMVGTAGEVDLLRRIAFQAIPMNLDSVV
ncbi:hypothetical protein [Paracidovorax anthurii]|uniref:Alanine dehydrogenase/pyridine nucleotide transhydrogenase NAD(H)-binding domain-containing protein n=1 Tax=Paracidovorax anthurii TaxID=78229 RepID=A0A328ZK05_9BURK|nr:hypothetical protein [Paracidovorax anthurii]RAR86480.1 hypothetical protein AX018_100166 [Paracidovorax anthurii]